MNLATCTLLFLSGLGSVAVASADATTSVETSYSFDTHKPLLRQRRALVRDATAASRRKVLQEHQPKNDEFGALEEEETFWGRILQDGMGSFVETASPPVDTPSTCPTRVSGIGSAHLDSAFVHCLTLFPCCSGRSGLCSSWYGDSLRPT